MLLDLNKSSLFATKLNSVFYDLKACPAMKNFDSGEMNGSTEECARGFN